MSASQSGWVWRKRTWGYGSNGVSSEGSLADQSVKLLASQESAKRRDNMRAYSNDRESDQLANLIFAPDPLSCFRYEHVHGGQKSAVPPEIRALMLFHDADEWIISNEDGIFSFNHICETLGLNPEALRKGLQPWRAKQTVAPPEERSPVIFDTMNLLGRKRLRLPPSREPSMIKDSPKKIKDEET
ncbi:MAG: hypothetical protein ACXW6K_19020 [Candidatus Binatia bacterium]